MGFRQSQDVGPKVDRWKSRFWYQYLPEGIFRIFFSAWFWTPPPSVTYASTAKQGKHIGADQFFPIAWPF